MTVMSFDFDLYYITTFEATSKMAVEKSGSEGEKDMANKQDFLSSAISDISGYVQLVDTKVSIIMAAVVAILVGIAACYEPIGLIVSKIVPCSWMGILMMLFVIFLIISIIVIFLFGILTISGHTSNIGYQSKWFLNKSTKEYSFHHFWEDIKTMKDDDIIENMSAELYKLNDIYRQKMNTFRFTLWGFELFIVSGFSIAVLFFLSLI